MKFLSKASFFFCLLPSSSALLMMRETAKKKVCVIYNFPVKQAQHPLSRGAAGLF